MGHAVFEGREVGGGRKTAGTAPTGVFTGWMERRRPLAFHLQTRMGHARMEMTAAGSYYLSVRPAKIPCS